MKSIFTNRNVSIPTKLNALRAYIWSVLLYGCESWTLNKDTERRIEAAEMWFIRRIMRVSWTERKTNIEVMEEAGYKRSLMKTIRKRQMEFLGHTCRTDGIEKLMLGGKIEGKKSRGRQRVKYLDGIKNYIAQESTDNIELLRRTDNREEWRALVVDVCHRSGT